MISSIQKVLRKFNLQIKRYPDLDVRRRLQILQHHNIDCILDIGANTGQFAIYMRNYGYEGKIISFEPLKSAYQKLNVLASKDNNWKTFNFALGHKIAIDKINISKNSSSSSILDMLPEHLNSAPHSKYVEKQNIEIKTLDSIFQELNIKKYNIMLKIDTQGYEKNVLEGGNKTLRHVKIIQLEMSLTPLYRDELMFKEMLNYLDQRGFDLISLENGFSNPKTGKLLQVDGVFGKRSYAESIK